MCLLNPQLLLRSQSHVSFNSYFLLLHLYWTVAATSGTFWRCALVFDYLFLYCAYGLSVAHALLLHCVISSLSPSTAILSLFSMQGLVRYILRVGLAGLLLFRQTIHVALKRIVIFLPPSQQRFGQKYAKA